MGSPSTQLPKGTSRIPLHPGQRGVAAADRSSVLPPQRSRTRCSAPRTPSLVKSVFGQLCPRAGRSSAKPNRNKYTDIYGAQQM